MDWQGKAHRRGSPSRGEVSGSGQAGAEKRVLRDVRGRLGVMRLLCPCWVWVTPLETARSCCLS